LADYTISIFGFDFRQGHPGRAQRQKPCGRRLLAFPYPSRMLEFMLIFGQLGMLIKDSQ
jgi:hypothetical protein